MNPAPDRADENIWLMIPDQPLPDHAGPVPIAWSCGSAAAGPPIEPSA